MSRSSGSAASDDSEPEPDLVIASLDEELTSHPAKPLLVVAVDSVLAGVLALDAKSSG